MKTVPPDDVKKRYSRDTQIGIALKQLHDAEEAKRDPTAVTKLGPLTLYRRDKKVGRWRYEKGIRTLAGTPLGGRFVKPPPEATLKMGMKRPATKK